MLREAEQLSAAGKTIAEVCQGLGIIDETFHCWRAKHRAMDQKEARRLRTLEEAGRRLKILSQIRRC